MRLRQIEIFYHVYRSGSISGAARDLSVSQPSVSKVLRHAEDQIGFELFRRVKGRLVPTPAADELFGEVEDIYHRVSIFNRSLEHIRKRKGGHIRLGVLPSLSLSVGPELVARMRGEDKDISFELTTLHSAEIADALLEKRIDIGIGFGPVDNERILGRRVGDGKLVLVSGDSLEEPVGLEALHEAEMIGMSESGPLGTMITSMLADRGIAPVEVATAHTYHVALSLVRKRVGLALTDQFTAYSHLGSGLQRYLLSDSPGFSIEVSTLSDHPFAELIGRACDTLEAVVRDLDAGITRLQPPIP